MKAIRSLFLASGFLVCFAECTWASEFYYDAAGNLINVSAVTTLPRLEGHGALLSALGHPLTLAARTQNAGAASYQWYRGGTAIIGGTDDLFYLPITSLHDAGSYSIVVSNAYGSVTGIVAQVS